MNMKVMIGLLGMMSLVAGCGIWAVGPDYKEQKFEEPNFVVPDAGAPTTNLTATGELKAATTNEDVRILITQDMLKNWWMQFNDDVLTNLVQSAISNNLSFLMAQQRLIQARWRYVAAAGDLFPKINMEGNATRAWWGKNTASGWSSGKNGKRGTFHGGFDASWEIDIFGGVRRELEQADAQIEGAMYDLEDAWVTLTAELGRQYISLRTIQERIKVARANLKLQSETYEILKSRLDSGIGDELAVNQAMYNVEQTRATIPTLLAQEEELMNAMAILVGSMPGALHSMLKTMPERDWLVAPQKLESISLNVIRLRPDVRSVERKLAAQVAAVGISKSFLFPKFYINGTVGLESLKAQKFFERNSLYSSIGPSFSWPIFQGGNIYANYKAEEAKMDEAILNYELTMQTALGETRNAYSAYTQEYHRYQSLQGAVKAAQDAVNISQDLYQNGLADFNNVLDAQRSLLTLAEAKAISRGNITLNLITLYKALGGGLAVEREKK